MAPRTNSPPAATRASDTARCPTTSSDPTPKRRPTRPGSPLRSAVIAGHETGQRHEQRGDDLELAVSARLGADRQARQRKEFEEVIVRPGVFPAETPAQILERSFG